MIRMENVYKRFGSQQVLDGINLDIKKNSITTIIGCSGCGKSVLIRHLIGLEVPDSGSIYIEDDNIVGMRSRELNKIRRRFGVLFQDAALFDSLSAMDNVAFPIREHLKLPEKEIREIVRKKLSQVGMTGHEHKFPNELSGGMRKRVGLARALALDPDVVLFDEPTTGLDPVIKTAIYQLILKTHRERDVTYVMASHDMRGVLTISHEIMMLFQGKIVATGTPDEMRYSSEPLVHQFTNGTAAGPLVVQ
jgi:phospholipid/cholesterol/gamma-HCH transport system ATP-binding protein